MRTTTLAPVHSTAEYCAPIWCRSAHTRLINPAINNAMVLVTGCLRPTPADNLPILAAIQPAELRRNRATLSLARRAMEPGHLLHSRSPAHRVQMHGASSRDTHLYPPHNNSVFLTTTTYVRCSGRSSVECGGGRQPCKTPHFISRHRYPPSRNDPPKKSLFPAQPPPHRCRTFPLLLVQMGYGLLCGL